MKETKDQHKAQHKAGMPNISRIYEIFDALNTETVIKMAKNNADDLDEETRSRMEEVRRVASEIGWSQLDITKALIKVLEKRGVSLS